MAKEKSFVCYANVTTAGVRQIMKKNAVTPGKDVVVKGAATALSAAAFATYLSALADANTLFNVTVHANVATAVTTLATAMMAGAAVGQRNRIKVGMVMLTEGANSGHPAFIVTKTTNGVKTIQTIPLDVA